MDCLLFRVILAPCWCTRTIDVSIICTAASWAPAKAFMILAQTPVRLRARRSFTRGTPRGLLGSIGLMAAHRARQQHAQAAYADVRVSVAARSLRARLIFIGKRRM